MTPAPKIRRRRRPWIAVSALSLVILVSGWVALWIVARHEALRIMDQWLTAEAARGRDWSCPDRTVSGFPLRLHVSCAHPRFSGKVGGVGLVADLGTLDAEVALYQPNAVDAWLGGPLTVRRDGAPDVTAHWDALLVEARMLTGDQARVAVVADELAAEDVDGRMDRARHAELRFAPAPARPATDKAYEVWLDVFDAGIPALDEILGTSDPLSIEQKGVLTGVQETAFEPWPVLLEQWRQGGGVFDLDTLKISKGDLKVEARGELMLDAQHRPSGRLQTALAGYEAFAARVGLPVRAVSVGGALAGLLGRKSADPAPSLPGAVTLPVVLADGRLSIGPFKTSVRLDPLY